MPRIPRVLVALALASSLVLAGCTGGPTPVSRPSAPTDTAAALAALPRATLSPAQPMRLAKGLVPPTDRWFSGLVFGATPQTVFPTPLAVSPTGSGLRVALPTVTTSADAVVSGVADGIGLDLAASGFVVTRYDALTVTMTYRDRRGPIADVTLAEGWPYVAITARRTLTVTTDAVLARTSAGSWRAQPSRTVFALRAPAASLSGARLRLPQRAVAVLYAVPRTADARTLATGARGVVVGGSAQGGLTARTATTTLRYATRGGAPTVLAARPGTRPAGVSCTGGTVLTVYGSSRLCTGTSTTTRVPRVEPADALDLTGLSAARRAAIAAQLHADLVATPAQPPDTYGGGKWLYRIANLLQLAKALRAEDDAVRARRLLGEALTTWTEPRGCAARADHCFVYDPVLRGVVGRAASFGSEQFNDHHFHYGYFLYAAAVAVQDRKALRSRLGPVTSLLAADIASPEASADFPQRRVFDPWAGHSWASGFAPFGDGNDEESSSEAVNAWNGLALWAAATGDAALRREAVWLLSSEAAAARRDWLEPDLEEFPGFAHAFVSLNWGGKRDSATWFSADPAAKLGVQLIPMSPVSAYLRGDPARMRRNLEEGRSAGTGLFADWLLMYEALAGGSSQRLQREAAAIPGSAIDSADSRAYLSAWIASRGAARGQE